MELLKIFAIIFLASFLGTSFGNWKGDVHYKTELVKVSSKESFDDYLNRQGDAGWHLFNFVDYREGRQYIFYK